MRLCPKVTPKVTVNILWHIVWKQVPNETFEVSKYSTPLGPTIYDPRRVVDYLGTPNVLLGLREQKKTQIGESIFLFVEVFTVLLSFSLPSRVYP